MKYGIIYADPPWAYRDKLLHHGGSAQSHYETMSVDDICSLPISKVCDETAVLFIWGTWPLLFECGEVIKAWGFSFKTCAFIWIKANRRDCIEQQTLFVAEMDLGLDPFFGMGNWTRSNTEFCLLAVKGKPKRVDNSVSQIIYSPIARHSEKPAETRDRIVKLCGDLPRVELFARSKTDGWDVWGNEVENDLILSSLPSRL